MCISNNKEHKTSKLQKSTTTTLDLAFIEIITSFVTKETFQMQRLEQFQKKIRKLNLFDNMLHAFTLTWRVCCSKQITNLDHFQWNVFFSYCASSFDVNFTPKLSIKFTIVYSVDQCRHGSDIIAAKDNFAEDLLWNFRVF